MFKNIRGIQKSLYYVIQTFLAIDIFFFSWNFFFQIHGKFVLALVSHQNLHQYRVSTGILWTVLRRSSAKFEPFLCTHYLVGTFWIWREQSLGCLSDVPMTAPSNFHEPGLLFLQYKNGSKNFYDLLGPLPTYTEGPSNLKKNLIALIPTQLHHR